jgi:hypothetical protein
LVSFEIFKFSVYALSENFFYRKKFSGFQKCSLSNMGRCPIPQPLFEKSGAKTFMGGYRRGSKRFSLVYVIYYYIRRKYCV